MNEADHIFVTGHRGLVGSSVVQDLQDGERAPLRISVITAVRNRIATVGEALDSVISQSWPDLQHIVIDGVSTDGTLELLEGRRNDIAVLVSERDSGIYEALNKGLALATGEVIGLMHSDDIYADERVLADVAAAFADPKIDAVYGDLEYVSKDDTSRVIRRWRSGEYSRARLAQGWMPPHPTLYLRCHVIERWGGFDASFRISADYDAILRYFGQGRIRPEYVPRVLVKMRVGGESNRSPGRVLRKSREDYRALRRNGIGGFGTLIRKNISKVGQFF
jgi:glycosyltransferase involved in cell wall biosynthesis